MARDARALLPLRILYRPGRRGRGIGRTYWWEKEKEQRGAERSPGALDPARRDGWSGIESREVISLDEKGKMSWEGIYGETTWRP